MIDIILKVWVVILIIALIICWFIMLRIPVVDHNRDVIIEAIYQYRIHCMYKHMLSDMNSVRYSDMEDVGKTLFRFWDWGFTRILPKDKFEMIKPYIK